MEKFGAVPIPVNKGDRQATNDFGTYNLPVGAEHPEAAADLLKFWFSPEHNIKFFQTHVPGHIPTLKTTRESAAYLESPNIAAIAPFVKAASAAAEKGTMSGAFYGPHELLGKLLAAEIYTQMVDRVVELGEEPREVAKWAQEESEALT
jgi:ABC-type glycerol-3-phosphate transport system substrate-binding protein